MSVVPMVRPPEEEIPRDERYHLKFHMGEAFYRVAATYHTILMVILEQVQNSIDAKATEISVVLNQKTRHVAIRDNGNGVRPEEMRSAMGQVCLTQKERDKLGRFGIGLISPLGKCDYWTFTSAARGRASMYNEWTFDSDDIRAQQHEVIIPSRERRDMFFVAKEGSSGPRGSTSVMWRTEVNIFRYAADKFVSRIDSVDALKNAIVERFGIVMQRNKVVLSLKFTNEKGRTDERMRIEANMFSGRPLDEVTLGDRSTGQTQFRLYIAPNTNKGRLGRVVVGESHNDYRFSFKLFATTARGILSDEAIAGLKSGTFEGEILNDKVTLHASRKSFEENDAFLEMCTAIDEWFRKHGAKHLSEEKEASRDQRYQALGLESLKQLEEMMKNPEFADLMKVLTGFSLGTVGKGHTPRNPNAVVGEQKERSVSVQKTYPERQEPSGKSDHQPAEDRPAHHPFTAAGPEGKKRTLVKRDSVGLQFSYIPMDGSNRVWELDAREGVLHFNVNHPIWVACEASDRKIKQLQETVAIYALMAQSMPDEHRDITRTVYEEALAPIVHCFHNSPSFVLHRTRSDR